MADFLDEKRKEIQARLKELQPAGGGVHSASRPAGLGALQGVAAAAPRAPPPARRAAVRRAAQHRGRQRAAGRRAAAPRGRQALELVKKRPGITIPELAEAMGIKQNYLYRVMPGLDEGGQGDEDGPRLAREGRRLTRTVTPGAAYGRAG